jgi:hypothetical protein
MARFRQQPAEPKKKEPEPFGPDSLFGKEK